MYEYDECRLCHSVIRRWVEGGQLGKWEHTEEHPAQPAGDGYTTRTSDVTR